MFSTHFSWPYEEKFVFLQRKYKQKIKVMTTIAISYNEKNTIAKKAMDFLLSLGVFKVHEITSPAKSKTMKAIADARSGKGVTHCNTFEDYLKATAE